MHNILNKTDYNQYQIDCEKWMWMEQYPENINQIIADIMDFDELTNECIIVAKKFNWNPNAKYNYPTDSNEKISPLSSAAEFRHIKNIKVLLDNGAVPTNEDYYSCLIGHSYGDWENCEKIVECITMFDDFGGEFTNNDKYDKYLEENSLEYWKTHCEFLYNLIRPEILTKSATKL